MEKIITSLNKPQLNDLMHYGVKGMKWKHHKQAEQLSPEKSSRKLTPDQKKRIKKILIATAAVTMVAVTAYYLHNQAQINTINIYGILKTEEFKYVF